MISALFEVLAEGLKLWNSKESTKYLDEVLKLQKEWLKEYEKPFHKRSNADLDHIEQQLHIISRQFVTALRK